MQIQDLTGSLSDSDFASIQGITTPLNVEVIFTSQDSKPGLNLQVHDMVKTANTLAIGVDPVHHYAFTHFGTGTGISKMDYTSIERAGNAEFHAGNWAAGVRAIINAADAASSQTHRSEVIIQQPTTVVERHTSPWPFVVGFGLLAVAVVLFVRWARRKSRSIENAAQEARDEAQEMRKRNIEERGWNDKFAANHGEAPAPAAPALPRPQGSTVASVNQSGGATAREVLQIQEAPVRVIHHYDRPAYQAPVAPAVIAAQPSLGYGGGDFLTGMLVGEALERPREVIREREVVREEVHHSRSYDDDTSSSSSSSSDWGSSSSDGGGGGGDFGGGGDSGGGFDGGGGGGDF